MGDRRASRRSGAGRPRPVEGGGSARQGMGPWPSGTDAVASARPECPLSVPRLSHTALWQFLEMLGSLALCGLLGATCRGVLMQGLHSCSQMVGGVRNRSRWRRLGAERAPLCSCLAPGGVSQKGVSQFATESRNLHQSIPLTQQLPWRNDRRADGCV